MKKHKYELITALLCFVLILVLAFVVGARVGQHDEKILAEEQYEQEMAQTIEELTEAYNERINDLERQLLAEQEIEHIQIDYVPMPVEYEVAEDIEVDGNVIAMLAQMALGEYSRIDEHPEHVAASMETVFNRVDSPDPYFPDTIAGVITQPNAYQGYSHNVPVDARYYDMALDCYLRWKLKGLGVSDYGYVIPDDCLSFHGKDGVNHFTLPDGTEWQWTLPNPYAVQEADLK